MSDLIQAILNKNFSLAEQSFAQQMKSIVEARLLEKKKEVAQDMCNDNDDSDNQINEVSQKTATKAYAGSNDPDDDTDKSWNRANRLRAHIKRKWGDKAADHADSHAYAAHFGRTGKTHGTDPLSDPIIKYSNTKRGKRAEAKAKLAGLKAQKKANLPEEIQLAERCADHATVKAVAKKTAKAAIKSHVARAHKAKQTKSLRNVFGVAPGKRRHQGPRTAKLEESWVGFKQAAGKAVKAVRKDFNQNIKPDIKAAGKRMGNTLKNDIIPTSKAAIKKALSEGKIKNKAIEFEEKTGRKMTNDDLKKDADDKKKKLHEALSRYTGRHYASLKGKSKSVLSPKKGSKFSLSYKTDKDPEDKERKEYGDAIERLDRLREGWVKKDWEKATDAHLQLKKKEKKEDNPDFVRGKKEAPLPKHLREMKGKGFLDKGIFASRKRKELAGRLDKKMDKTTKETLGRDLDLKTWDTDAKKLSKNKKYMRMNMIRSKVKYPEYFKK